MNNQLTILTPEIMASLGYVKVESYFGPPITRYKIDINRSTYFFDLHHTAPLDYLSYGQMAIEMPYGRQGKPGVYYFAWGIVYAEQLKSIIDSIGFQYTK